MNAAERTAVEWPTRIYYVCNSTAGIVVNATPLVQACADRIVGMKILCGVRDSKKPTPPERRESIRPADRLTAFAAQLGIRNIDDPMYGDPDSYAAWSGVLDESAERATALNATLVYNVTGGPRTLPLAVFLGASNESRASIVAVAVSFSDRTCRQLVFDHTGILTDERPLPQHGRIGFDGLITLYGYREQDPASRTRRQAFIEKYREVADRILGATRGSGGKSAIAALHWSMQFDHTGAARGPDPTPFCVELEHLRANPNSLERAVGALRGLYGLKIVRSGRKIRCIEVQQEATREFVGGVWLEAVVFGLVCDVFRNIPNTAKPEIIAGAKLAVESPPPRSSNVPPLDNELDVAITIDDQLHVIEVKAVTNSKGFGEYITKLVTLRQELGSQVMRTFLVAPLLSKRHLESGGFIERAAKQGVRLRYGLPRVRDNVPGALELLKDELEKLV